MSSLLNVLEIIKADEEMLVMLQSTSNDNFFSRNETFAGTKFPAHCLTQEASRWRYVEGTIQVATDEEVFPWIVVRCNEQKECYGKPFALSEADFCKVYGNTLVEYGGLEWFMERHAYLTADSDQYRAFCTKLAIPISKLLFTNNSASKCYGEERVRCYIEEALDAYAEENDLHLGIFKDVLVENLHKVVLEFASLALRSLQER